MNSACFAGLTRSISTLLSRRSLAGMLSLAALTVPGLAEAKKHKKHKHKKKKEPTFNDVGCVNVGGFCKNNGQCCSGICKGKKGKGKCLAHNASTCQAGQENCVGTGVECTSETGELGVCTITTGQANYCEVNGNCYPCTKDADCVAVCGEGAACLDCADCSGGTACAGPSVDSCNAP
jgi:hypothetical protein